MNSIGYDFGNNLVIEPAQADGTKLTHALWATNFGDKSDICVVKFLQNLPSIEKALDSITHINLHNWPVFLVEYPPVTIGPRGF